LDAVFVFPTTLLPLLVLMDRTGAVLESSIPSVRGYVAAVSRPDAPPAGATYLVALRRGADLGPGEGVLDRLVDLSGSTRLFSRNRDAYHYLLSELVDNIDQHAGADHAYVMAQYYPIRGEIEASFMDDGVTIPGSLERGIGRHYPPEDAVQAIVDALGGLSSRTAERGFGLRTSVRLTNALGGEVLIVSGRGAVVAEPAGGVLPFRLSEDRALQGTLVSLRIPEGDKTISLYDYLEG
jgi:hypothetical protein